MTHQPEQQPRLNKSSDAGSILLYILLGIVLLGSLTVALRNTTGAGSSDIDKEDMILKAGQMQRYGNELAASVATLLSNGLGEADIRFAHDDAPTEYGDITIDPTHQVFGKTGGKANYRPPPEGVNDGSPWEFFGTTRIIQVGSERAELIAVLPNVTETFCKAVDGLLGFKGATLPTDSSTGSSPDCVMGTSTNRFTGTFNDLSPNLLDETTFSRLPAQQACVLCAADNTYHYYYVLLSR